jgi:hypothetical protein
MDAGIGLFFTPARAFFPEREKADQELKEITEATAKELPEKRHDLRMAALYVNLSEPVRRRDCRRAGPAFSIARSD